MKKCIYSFLFILFVHSSASAKYTTPGTGVKLSLDNLVTNSGGVVTFVGDSYLVSDTVIVSLNDTLSITVDATVKFALNTYFAINGTILVDPPTGVLFTQSTAAGYNGIRLDASVGSYFKKLTLEYAVSLRLSDCNPLIENCIFRFNRGRITVTPFGSAAINLFRSNPVINNCQFIQNQGAAIIGGLNIANAPIITNSLFDRNDVSNDNTPQINIGGTGVDTMKIFNNRILGGNTNSGGISIFTSAVANALIKGNLIRNNRYGINLQGGSVINTVVSYNTIDSNNIQNNSALGGSGIAFSGGSATSQQNSIVTGNIFRFNLWGITIQNRAKPNLGNLVNIDTTDNGKNFFINNTNATTPFIDLYNNSIDTIFAQGNYWSTDDSAAIETKIFHKPDQASLGLVYFTGYMTIPVELLNFSATAKQNAVLLRWQTSSESNSHSFDIERSDDGRSFYTVGTVTAAGNSSVTRSYSFSENNISSLDKPLFYRLKQIDRDGRFKYSKVVSLRLIDELRTAVVKFYPAVISGDEILNAAVTSNRDQAISLRFFDGTGKLLAKMTRQLVAGYNSFTVQPVNLPAGLIFVKLTADRFQETIKLVKK